MKEARIMLRHILRAAVILPLLAVTCPANDNLLERVPQLQEAARRSNGGEMGCGTGFILLHTSRGPVVATSGSDPVHVFGQSIRVADLLSLLKARAEYNRTGAANPMSGDVSDLAYVTLHTLSLAQDPDSIPVIAELLKDKDEVIRGWSAIALYKLAECDELRPEVKGILFPQAAIQSAKSRGKEPPEWVQAASGI
ncbi:MAG TPA: hypothetical protein VF586_02570 [Pyrinomonadaceae bacterium]